MNVLNTLFSVLIAYPVYYLGIGLGATGRWFWRHKLLIVIAIMISPCVLLPLAQAYDLTQLKSLTTGVLFIYFALFIAIGAVLELNKPGGGIGAFAAFVALALGGYGVWKVATTLGWW